LGQVCKQRDCLRARFTIGTSLPRRKQAKDAFKRLNQEWRQYLRLEYRPFFLERYFPDLSIHSALYKELMEEPATGASGDPLNPRLVASASSFSLTAPTLEQDWQSMFSAETAELSTPRAHLQDLPALEIEAETGFEEESSATHSREVEQVLKSAALRLVSIEDPNQVVAVQEKLQVSGGYGDIYRGRYIVKDEAPFEYLRYVVAKKSRPSMRSMTETERRQERTKLRKRMMKEARIAEYLDHPAITHYFGLFAKEDELADELADFFLVSDYVNGGLARDYLVANRTAHVAEKLFHDLMDGLTFMHSEQRIGTFDKKMICHGDLKGNNYLVEIGIDSHDPGKPQITGKIIDFGLSHIISSISSLESGNSQVSDALRWRAPELANVDDDDMATREQLMEKADVWSFALTSLEVVQNLTYPFPSLKNAKAFLRAWALTPEILIELLPKSNPDELLSQAAFEIMMVCWRLDPMERPHMREAQARYHVAHQT